MTIRRFGWRLDPHDPGDAAHAFGTKLAPTLQVAVPDSIERLPLGPLLDQGNLGSCVAQAVADAIYASHMRQFMAGGLSLEQAHQVCQLASRLAIYYLARATHKMQRYDVGTYIRAAFQILLKFGFARESDWPYIVSRFADMPPTKIFRGGIDQKEPTEYHRIFESGEARCDAVKLALAHGHAVVVGFDVDDAFTAHDFDRVWDGPTSPIVGGHAVVLGSYDEVGPEAKNSWKDWSGDGWARFSWRAVRDHLRDLWVLRHSPLYSA